MNYFVSCYEELLTIHFNFNINKLQLISIFLSLIIALKIKFL